MNLRHNYYYFKSALSPRICDDILQYGKSQNSEIAVTGGVSSDDKNNYNVDGTLKKRALKNLQKKPDACPFLEDICRVWRPLAPCQ